MWFAAMGDVSDEPWTVHFVWKLLHGDAGTLSLLAGNPFPEGPPRYVRAVLYRYEMQPYGSPGGWRRTELGEWLPPLSTDDPRIVKFLRLYGWLLGEDEK